LLFFTLPATAFATIDIVGFDSVSSVRFEVGASFIDGSGVQRTIGDISAAAFTAEKQVLLLADRGHIYSAGLNIDNGSLAGVDFHTDSPLLASHQLDSEGLAVRDDYLFVSTEQPSELFRCHLNADKTGTNGSCTTPFETHRFAGAGNLGLEALCITPTGDELLTATEAYLAGDDAGVIRLTAYAVAPATLRAQAAYLIESFHRPQLRLVELLALDDRGLDGGQLLSLERGYEPQVGNEIRLYLVTTHNATNVANCSALSASYCKTLGQAVRPVQKKLVLQWTLSEPLDGRIKVDNYEAMALIPGSFDGTLRLLLVNDDNSNPQQIGTQFVMIRLLTADFKDTTAAPPRFSTASAFTVDWASTSSTTSMVPSQEDTCETCSGLTVLCVLVVACCSVIYFGFAFRRQRSNAASRYGNMDLLAEEVPLTGSHETQDGKV